MNMHLRQVEDLMADPNKAPWISKSDLQMELLDLSQVYADTAAKVDRVSDLLDRLPGWVGGREKARSEIQDGLKKTHTEMLATIKENTVPNPDVKNHVLILLGIVQVEAFALQVALWQESVTKTAKAQQRIADILYNWCTWLAYALFVLGVALALIGKLHGVGGVENES
jgi:hypothetical protein